MTPRALLQHIRAGTALARAGLAGLTLGLALVLVVYLPLEPGLLALIPSQAYWPLRLLPDLLIALLAAATLALDGRTPPRPVTIFWAIALAASALTAMNAARGIDPGASINSMRVLIRYVVLGLLLWRWVGDPLRSSQLFAVALVVSGLIQVGFGLMEGIPRWIVAILTGMPTQPIDGTLGRYDRFGLLMTALALLLLAKGVRQLSRWHVIALAVALICLFASTSRQAEVGLAAGAMIAAVLPGVLARTRVLAVACAVAGTLMVVLSPASIGQSSGSVEPGPGQAHDQPFSTPHATGSTSPVPGTTSKGSTQLSVDPNANFRLYLNVVLAPWAVTQEPLFGFGPESHLDPDPSTPLAQHVQDAGMDWTYALRFMNDSNYATLIIQFGLPFTVMFLLLVVGPVGLAVRATFRYRRDRALTPITYAITLSAAVGLAAAFGPGFEIRTASSLLWISIFLAVPLSVGQDSRATDASR